MLRSANLKQAVRKLSAAAASNPAGNLPKPDVLCRVVSVISSLRCVPTTIPTNAFFAADLGLDSMLRSQLAEKFEEEFRVSLPAGQIDNYPSIESVVDYYSSHPKAR